MVFQANKLNSSTDSYPKFRGKNDIDSPTIATGPIDTVQKTIESGMDTIVKTLETEKEKKSNKKAIAVGSSVLVLASTVMLLNPRYSPKFVQKLKTLQYQVKSKIEESAKKSSILKQKVYEFSSKILDTTLRGFNFACNINTAKDVGFKYLCTDSHKNIHIKRHPHLESVLRKIDEYFVKLMKKPHAQITKWFDGIARATIKRGYKKSNENLAILNDMIEMQLSKLPTKERRIVRNKLKAILAAREHYSTSSLMKRLNEQEASMINLERDFVTRWQSYHKGFSNKWQGTAQHIDKNLSLWVEDLLKTKKASVVEEGMGVYEKLFGNGKNKTGLYDDVFEIMKKYLTPEEQIMFEKRSIKASKHLKKVTHAECFEYFDKKRDLMVGGAPTDIATALGGFGLCGIAVASADGKEKRISRLVTTGIPVLIGIGSSLVFATMLTSGALSILYGFGISAIASKIGTSIDKNLLGNKDEDEEQDLKHNKEVKNA